MGKDIFAISVDEELLKKFNEYCLIKYINKSQCISGLVEKFLKNKWCGHCHEIIIDFGGNYDDMILCKKCYNLHTEHLKIEKKRIEAIRVEQMNEKLRELSDKGVSDETMKLFKNLTIDGDDRREIKRDRPSNILDVLFEKRDLGLEFVGGEGFELRKKLVYDEDKNTIRLEGGKTYTFSEEEQEFISDMEKDGIDMTGASSINVGNKVEDDTLLLPGDEAIQKIKEEYEKSLILKNS